MRHAGEEGSSLALNLRVDVNRRPQHGYQWPREKDYRPPKIKQKIGLKMHIAAVAVEVAVAHFVNELLRNTARASRADHMPFTGEFLEFWQRNPSR